MNEDSISNIKPTGLWCYSLPNKMAKFLENGTLDKLNDSRRNQNYGN
jgi:hypothetical protein